MKTFVLRTTALVVLAGASWAVWAADGETKRTPVAPVAATTAKPKPALKVVSGSGNSDARATAQVVPPKPEPIAATSEPVPTPVAATPVVPTTTAALPAKSPSASTGSTLTTDSVHISLSTLAPTPEMWFYEQLRQDYNNPALQARLRGEQVAAERRARMAARAWYGVSNSRPTANVTPFMYYYSPFWGSNTRNPFIWSGRQSTQVIIEARRPSVSVSNFGSW